MGLGNPVNGRIQAKDETWDRRSFRVTSTFREHVLSGCGPGIDFGNGRGGDPVLAMADGVAQLSIDPNGAKIVRVKHPQWGTDYSGYAHLNAFSVRDGQRVTRGQQVGTVGMTGATANHLHAGYNKGGREIDFWPMLDQNQLPDTGTGVEMDTVQRIYPARRDCATRGGALTGYRLNPPPLTKAGTFAAGSQFHSDSEFTITPTPPGWPAGPYQRVVDGFYEGYLLANSQIDLALEPQPGGSDGVTAFNAGVLAATALAATAKK